MIHGEELQGHETHILLDRQQETLRTLEVDFKIEKSSNCASFTV